jgi:hypothetical protein
VIAGDQTRPPDRLGLVRALSAAAPSFALLWAADVSVDGSGDLDAAATRADWGAVWQVHKKWALDGQARAVVSCAHVPGLLMMAAIFPGVESFSELDVSDEIFFRARTLFNAEQIATLAIDDRRGFRRVRPGAEGVIVFLMKSLRRGGRPDRGVLGGRGVYEMLDSDPEGARMAIELLGRPGRHLAHAIETVRAGESGRADLLRVEASALVGALRSPKTVARRAWFRARRRGPCPVAAALEGSRRVPSDVDAWLLAVADRHPVIWG